MMANQDITNLEVRSLQELIQEMKESLREEIQEIRATLTTLSLDLKETNTRVGKVELCFAERSWMFQLGDALVKAGIVLIAARVFNLI